ncbi:MAG: HD domain-containing protein [Ghiorsea sp.]
MRRIIHYIVAMIIIPIYGIQVCPFIESLTVFQVALPIMGMLLIQYFLGMLLWKHRVNHRALDIQVRSAFNLELTLFLVSGALLLAYNTLLHGFPVVSGLKLIVGMIGLGFFAASDLALEAERKVAKHVQIHGTTIDPELNYFPITSKIAWFASVSVLLVVGIFMLLVIKDLDWLVKVGDSISLVDGRISILKEFGFVLAIILPHTLNIIFSYAQNIKAAFKAQNTLLTQASLGNYTCVAPVSSADEFGVMAKHGNQLVATVRERTDELNRTRDLTILSLATLAETRDNETGAHILRTQRYVRALAEQLKHHPKFSDDLDDDTIDLLFKSAPLHDIGKVGIPDAILLKPGKLTDEEFDIMKTHANIGAQSLAIAEKELGSNSFLLIAQEIALTHHEKWDGSGYPVGLSGHDIPCSGRLMAVADVYDALISKRVYKPAFTHEKARDIIIEGAGKHFDPDVVDAFITIDAEFQEIARIYGDASTQ